MNEDVWELHQELRQYRQRIFLNVVDERDRQVAKWGDQRHEDRTGSVGWQLRADAMKRFNDQFDGQPNEPGWNTILLEEIYEALSEPSNSAELRTELVQCAAVIFSWLEDIDRR